MQMETTEVNSEAILDTQKQLFDDCGLQTYRQHPAVAGVRRR
jgi:hypothetical protein